MTMTAEEAAAVAIALRMLSLRDGRPQVDRYIRGLAAWGRVENPRTWSDHARLEALGLDVS